MDRRAVHCKAHEQAEGQGAFTHGGARVFLILLGPGPPSLLSSSKCANGTNKVARAVT